MHMMCRDLWCLSNGKYRSCTTSNHSNSFFYIKGTTSRQKRRFFRRKCLSALAETRQLRRRPNGSSWLRTISHVTPTPPGPFYAKTCPDSRTKRKDISNSAPSLRRSTRNSAVWGLEFWRTRVDTRRECKAFGFGKESFFEKFSRFGFLSDMIEVTRCLTLKITCVDNNKLTFILRISRYHQKTENINLGKKNGYLDSASLPWIEIITW